MGKKKGEVGANLITIRGIVIPVDWDKKGNVVGVAISTFNEDEHLVDNNEEGARLMQFIRQEVEVSSILRKVGNRQIIIVNKIQP